MRLKYFIALLISVVMLMVFSMTITAENIEQQEEQNGIEEQDTEEMNRTEEVTEEPKETEEDVKDEPDSSVESVLDEGNGSEEEIEKDTPDTSNQNVVPEESPENPSDKVEEESVEKTEKASEQTEEKSSPKVNLMRVASVFPLEKGKRHNKVIELKKMLNRTKFNGVMVTNYYGNFTVKQVKKFQKFIGLPVTGKVDKKTFTKLQELVDNPLQEGVRHPDTIALKKNLNKLGFGNIKVTSYYGSFTTKRVKDFQKYYGLKATGVADKATRIKIDELINNPLQQGNRHNDLIDLKKKLNWTGYGNIKVTTFFGSFTEKRVKQFQRDQGLPVNGMIDSATKQKLDNYFVNTMKKGSRNKGILKLKRNLNQLGFGKIKVTTLYGSFTERKVREFQKYYGLNATGQADLATLDKITELVKNPFQKGKRHKKVIQLKKDLNRLDFGNIKVTTLYGSFTEKRVKDFQRYYGLEVTGIADKKTLNKIDEIISSPYQKGKRHKDISQLKRDLNAIGFGKIKVTTYFGSYTEKRVKDFQRHYGLKVNGIMDPPTLAKLQKLEADPYRQGRRHTDIIQLKKDLNRLGFGKIKVTSLYGSFTAKRVKDFQAYYGLKVTGKADKKTRNKIDEILSSPYQKGKRHEDIVEIKEKLNRLGFGKIKVTSYFGSFTEKKIRDFQRTYHLPISGIIDEVTLRKINNSKINNNNIKIFLDPGHGGYDSGASAYRLREKDVALDIALHTANQLSNLYRGIDVKLSRQSDIFIPLEERARMANTWGANYFVSIHNNSHLGSAHGFESYIHNSNVSTYTREKQIEIHNYISKKLKTRNNISDRGKKTANFNVLRNTNMPSILLEYLFIDHVKENALLSSSKYRKFLGRTTADAIANAFDLKKK